MLRNPLILVTAVASALTASFADKPAQAQSFEIRPIALSNQSAPDTEAGTVFFTFDNPVLSGTGDVAFRATVQLPGVSQTEGVWQGNANGLGLVARQGDQAPDPDPGVTFRAIGGGTPPTFSALNAAGEIAFPAILATDGGVDIFNDEGIWAGSPGNVHVVAREGDAAPGTGAGVSFISNGAASLNESGQVAFRNSLIGPGVDSTNDLGLWVGTDSASLALVAREGDHAPGTNAGVVFVDLSAQGFRPPVLSANGNVVFAAGLSGSGVDELNRRGIWIRSATGLALVVRSGDPAPGTDPGINFFSLADPVLNNAGAVAFSAGLIGGGVLFNTPGIWSGLPSNLELVARAGLPAPVTEAGTVFSDLSTPILNGAGDVAFHATLTGPSVNQANNQGIWIGSPGNLHLLVRQGAPAPGTAAGVVFGNLTFSAPALNALGQVAFFAQLAGPGVTFDNNEGIWVGSSADQLTLFIRKGGTIVIAPGDSRTVNGLDFVTSSGNEDGRASGFNDSGQLAFRAFFTDGTAGVFVAGLVPPTPTLLLNQLVDTVIDMHLSHGTETALLAKLQSALKKLGDGNEANDQAAVSLLGAFKATVAGNENGHQISKPDADLLLARADEIIAALQGA